MEYKDYYKILGLERGATQDEIKRAFRKLARKHHPDVSKDPDAEATMLGVFIGVAALTAMVAVGQGAWPSCLHPSPRSRWSSEVSAS